MVLKFPNTPKQTLAKKFVKENPKFLLSVEEVRDYIRTITGSHGSISREFNVDFRTELAKLKKAMPKGDTEREEPYHIPKANRNILVIGDLHIPYHNDEAIFAALEYGAEQNVDTIIINGDLLDFALISRHEKDLRKRSVGYEIAAAKIFLEGLRNMFPKALIINKNGNHCMTGDTEILTENGFVKFTDLKEGDMVAQFDENRNISYSLPNAIIKRMYEGDIYDISNNYTRQLVTDKHRVLIGNEFVEARNVKIGDVKNIPTSGQHDGVGFNLIDKDMQVAKDTSSITKIPYNDMVYCVEMPLGTIITRYEGKVAFTGNCVRYQKWIMQKAPELLDIEGTSLPELLGLNQLNIINITDKRYIYAGKIAIFHGHEVGMTSGGVNPARTLRLKLNKSAITNHFHRETKDMGRNLDEQPYSCYSNACLCDLYPAYMPINQWTHGFIHLKLDKHGNYNVQQKSIIDGVIY
jgi:hypothetical protein